MASLTSIQQTANSMAQGLWCLRANSCAAIISMICLSHAACLAAGQGDKPIVATAGGKVEGFQTKNGVLAFLGIPFGQPQTKQGPVAPQPVDDDVPPSKFAQDEDCLNLDIWTPGIDGRKRPVIVYIHGGSFMFGASSDPAYDGANISKRGDIVFASINYRVGMLGFLYLEDFGTEYQGSGSNGIRDEILALRWLKNNIARFGGDPENITIMGESAGGANVLTLIGLPEARGLFQKAIAESGGISAFRTREEAKD